MPSPQRIVRELVQQAKRVVPKVPARDPVVLHAMEMGQHAIEDGVLDPPRRTYVHGLSKIALDLKIPERTVRRLRESNPEFKQWVEVEPGTRRRYRMERDPFVLIHLRQEAALVHAAGYARVQPRDSTGRYRQVGR